MKLPFVILNNVTKEQKNSWNKYFYKTKNNYLEALWRRNQRIENAKHSLWKNKNDVRRKLIYIKDIYKLRKVNANTQFVLDAPYLWVELLFPSNEIEIFTKQIIGGLKKGSWKQSSNNLWLRNNIRVSFKTYHENYNDKKAKRYIPSNYAYLGFELYSTNTNLKLCRKGASQIWGILRHGIRKIQKSGKPKIINSLKKFNIIKYLPAQFELGSGPSLEAGIPPLHLLHKIYGLVDDKTKKFILNPDKDDLFLRILRNPELFYSQSSLIFKNIVKAKPTNFHNVLKKLYDNKMLVGPIITNNFDSLPNKIGLKELCVRTYKESKIIPKIMFHSRAKSLIVVGAHADRRLIQKAARKHGLKILYIDPGGFLYKNKWQKYSLEAPRNNDLLVKTTANNFAGYLNDKLFPH